MEPRHGETGRLPRMLRGLERKLGADREGRTLWVWAVPAATVVITFAVLAFIGVQGQVDLSLTLPMALVLSVFLGVLSAIYLTAPASDERDQDEPPDDRHGPGVPPERPPPDGAIAPTVVRLPVRPPRPAEQPTPVGSGSPSRH
ncbi:MAG TPA: hypothetical protein VG520_06905 [Candidatus Dormibacteraeota bacterium]|nr:hypothetical protein [Candidatus Dormibacteraeota bacterium]